jgi:hypothetical protein
VVHQRGSAGCAGHRRSSAVYHRQTGKEPLPGGGHPCGDEDERQGQRGRLQAAQEQGIGSRAAGQTAQQRLEKAKSDSQALVELVNDAIGKTRPTLPKAIEISDDAKSLTVGLAEAATRMINYYFQKVLKLRERNVGCTPPATSWPKQSSKFSFSHCTANKIAKVMWPR